MLLYEYPKIAIHKYDSFDIINIEFIILNLCQSYEKGVVDLIIKVYSCMWEGKDGLQGCCWWMY